MKRRNFIVTIASAFAVPFVTAAVPVPVAAMKNIPNVPNRLYYPNTLDFLELSPFLGFSDPSRRQMYGNNLGQKVVADKQPPDLSTRPSVINLNNQEAS